MIITNSDMGKFMGCRRSWFLGSYLGLRRKAEPRTGALPFGSRVHVALEDTYTGKVEDPVDSWDRLMEYEYALAAQTNAFTDGLEKEDKYGRAMLSGYLEWAETEGGDSDFEIIGVESKLDAPLVVDTPYGPVELLLRGKLDRRLQRKSDGAILVGDFKTTGRLDSATLLSYQRSPQPRLYMLLERQQVPDGTWVAGAVFTLLRKVLRTKASNPPYYARFDVHISEFDLEQYRVRLEAVATEMLTVADALDNGADHRKVAYFHTSWQCGTCPFQQPCIMMQADSMAAAQDMLREQYETHDVYQRYSDETATEGDLVVP